MSSRVEKNLPHMCLVLKTGLDMREWENRSLLQEGVNQVSGLHLYQVRQADRARAGMGADHRADIAQDSFFDLTQARFRLV